MYISNHSSSTISSQSDDMLIFKSHSKEEVSSEISIITDYLSIEERREEEKGMILKHISGYATSGEMTAILGASGAGKTTLLSILCGRNSNYTGVFKINGKEVSDSSLRKVCRFVRQNDLFYEYLTVEEHLYYQAILRLGDRATQQIRNRLVWVLLTSLSHE